MHLLILKHRKYARRFAACLKQLLKSAVIRRSFGGIAIVFVSFVLILAPIQIPSGQSQVSPVSIVQAANGDCVLLVEGALPQASPCPAGVPPGGTITAGAGGAVSVFDQNGKDITGIGCNFGVNPSICITNIVYVFTVGAGSAFTYIASGFFTIAVHLALTSIAYAQGFVSSGWTVARDIANMAFLFILIYIALNIMFTAETSGTATTLAWVIVMALLVNFSFFLTRVVIDAGNIAAVEIYNVIPADANPCTTDAQNASPACKFGGKDITASIMNAIDVQGLFNTDNFQNWFKDNGFLNVLITLSILYIAVGAILAILGFAFFAAGAAFLIRIVVLWFLIIVAPLAFAARALPSGTLGPGGSKWFNKWFDELICQSFYPAIFLFIFLILALFMSALNGVGGQGGLINTIFGNFNNAGVANESFLYHLGTQIAVMAIELGFVVIFIKIALDQAKSLSCQTGGYARSFGNWIQRRTLGAVKSTGRFGGRQALRGGGYLYQQGVGRAAAGIKGAAERRGFGTSWAGYRFRQGLEKAAAVGVGGARSFRQFETSRQGELREREGIRQVGEKIAALPQYDSLNKRKIEAEQYDRYKKLLDARGITGLTPEEQREFNRLDQQYEGSRYEELSQRERSGTLTAVEGNELFKLRTKQITSRSVPKELNPEEQNQLARLEDQVKKMDVPTLERLTASELTQRAHLFNARQLEGLMNSRKFSQNERDSIRDKWNARGTAQNPFQNQFGATENKLNAFDKSVEELVKIAGNDVDLERKNAKNMEDVIKREQEALDVRRRAAQSELAGARQTFTGQRQRINNLQQQLVNARTEREKARIKGDLDNAEKRIPELKADFDKKQAVVDRNNKIQKTLSDLESARKEVPQHGDARTATEFVAGDIDIRNEYRRQQEAQPDWNSAALDGFAHTPPPPETQGPFGTGRSSAVNQNPPPFPPQAYIPPNQSGGTYMPPPPPPPESQGPFGTGRSSAVNQNPPPFSPTPSSAERYVPPNQSGGVYNPSGDNSRGTPPTRSTPSSTLPTSSSTLTSSTTTGSAPTSSPASSSTSSTTLPPTPPPPPPSRERPRNFNATASDIRKMQQGIEGLGRKIEGLQKETEKVGGQAAWLIGKKQKEIRERRRDRGQLEDMANTVEGLQRTTDILTMGPVKRDDSPIPSQPRPSTEAPRAGNTPPLGGSLPHTATPQENPKPDAKDLPEGTV